MRILFSPCHYIYDVNKWGTEISWVFNIANRIASKNPGSVVVTGSNQLHKRTNYKIFELQHKNNYIDLGAKNALLYNLRYTFKTISLFQNYDFDLLHHVLPFGFENTFNLAIIFHKKTLPVVIGPIQAPLEVKDYDLGTSITSEQNSRKNGYTLNNIIFNCFKPLLTQLSKATLLRATKIVVINKKTKQLLNSKGIPDNKIIVIAPGIDTKFFHPSKNIKSCDEKFTVITTSKLLNRKRIDLIIKAIGEVSRYNKNIHLMIVGAGPQKKALEELVQELKLDDFITFTGYMPQTKIGRYYQEANLFVSMSEDESWGQVYLEAMACGLPIITTRNSGSTEIMEENKCGYFVDLGDYIQLAERIMRLMENHDLVKKIGKYSRQLIVSKYDWDKVIIPKYLSLYKKVVEDRI